MASASGAAKSKECYPEVKRFSALLDYLELCEGGASLWCTTLDTRLDKQRNGLWRGGGAVEDAELSAKEVVLNIRFNLCEDDAATDPDKVVMLIEPVDRMTVKREIASYEETLEEPEFAVTLAVIDITGDGPPIETATFDGGPCALQVQEQFESYQLPLHLRLPPPPPPPATSLADAYSAELELLNDPFGMELIHDSSNPSPSPSPSPSPTLTLTL
jgi:hypothetical protein